MKWISLLLLLLPFPVSAGDWTKADTVRQWAFTSVLAVDWLQTRQSVNNGYVESNPILGSAPPQERVDAYFAATALGHYMIARWLSPEARKAWQYVWIGVEANSVGRNYSIGVRISF